MKATAKANSNIAIIKYWGRRDEEQRIPSNSSISFTMDDKLQSVTSVEFDPALTKDSLRINRREARPAELARVSEFLSNIRRVKKVGFARVVSENSFPTAAGLASSASGFAALSGAACKAAGLDCSARKLSALARLGSGSAARSVLGGAVEWKAGSRLDGSDCYAVQLSPPEDWKHLRNVIAIASSHEKRISSTDAMARTVRTSGLFSARLKDVDRRLRHVRRSIKERDFGGMARVIMEESDSMHAVMLDSWPPIIYLKGPSLEVIDRVVELNASFGRNVAAYTFDAGPNAHVYTTKEHADEVRRMLSSMEGIEEVLVCGVGEGLRFTDAHLF